MHLRVSALLLLAAVLAGLAATAAHASGPRPAYRPGEVVVRTAEGTRVHRVTDDSTVLEEASELARRPGVLSATPNWIARLSAYIPNDPGRGSVPGNWQRVQWNLLPGTGVDAPTAWENLIKVGRPGGQGVTIAVLDTGVAYRNRGRFAQSPDLATERFRKGYDFVSDDAYPLDENGHGTHVASTIAETADNGVALVGLAYNARIMPVRVLDQLGEGDSVSIARGIRFAARSGAKIINLSFEFDELVTAAQIPDILDALRYARNRGSLVIGAAGNASGDAVAYPARARQVLSVGATTEHGCAADYSNVGKGLDLVAPGGGADADVGDPGCAPEGKAGRDIIQMTFKGRAADVFGLPSGYQGTSMAAPHVSATAALIVASGVIGPEPTPEQIEEHLKRTATDLGRPGYDRRYGAGLINAGVATTPPPPAVIEQPAQPPQP
jgi:serine protease